MYFLVIGLSPTGSTLSAQANGNLDTTTLFSSTPGRPSSSSSITSPSPTIPTSTTTAMRPKQSTDNRRPDNHPYAQDTNYSTRYPTEHRYGSTENHPPTDRYPQNKYSTQYGSSAPPLPTNGLYGHLNDRDKVSTTDQLHFYQDLRPTYSYPMLYEKNYPLPNDKFIGYNKYAQNVPTVASDFYRPVTSSVTATQSYGSSVSTTNSDTATDSYPNRYGGMTSITDNNYRPPSTANSFYDRDRPTRYNHTGSVGYQPPTLATHFIDRPTGGYSSSSGK